MQSNIKNLAKSVSIQRLQSKLINMKSKFKYKTEEEDSIRNRAIIYSSRLALQESFVMVNQAKQLQMVSGSTSARKFVSSLEDP